MTALLDTTTRSLHGIALGKQREGRVPGLFAGVARGGYLVWGEGVGLADLGPSSDFRVPTTSSWSRPTPRPSSR